MKKRIVFIFAILLFLGSSLYAANGDLYVGGRVYLNDGYGIGSYADSSVTPGFHRGMWIPANSSYGSVNFVAHSWGHYPLFAFRDTYNMATWVAINNGYHTLAINGTAWCTNGVWSGSDEKLKKNILPISNALSTVLRLGGVSYEWKDEYQKVKETPDGPEIQKKKNPEGRHFGVIAQEIEKVLPDVVKEDADGTKGVNYDELIPVLIEAIKEQQAQIERQQRDIEQLKNIALSSGK